MKRAASFLLTAALLGPFAAAQQHPTVERGFHSEKVYQFGSTESVNLFNGNVLVTPAIGGTYPVSAGLSYRVPLMYNAKMWEYVTVRDVEAGREFTQAQLDPRSNAGIGWRMSFGRLKWNSSTSGLSSVTEYEGSDGAIHKLHTTKNPGDPAALEEANTWYTRDGSQIRVRKVGARLLVEFAGGETHEYENVSSTDWRIVRMRDQFVNADGTPKNFVNFTYAADSTRCTDEVAAWLISDSHSRQHDICFKSQTHDGKAVQTVSEVVLSGFQGSVDRYTFGYTQATLDRERRGGNQYWGDSNTVSAPTLTSITLPDDSQYEMTYWSSAIADGAAGGHLKQLTLPTGGTIAWEYQRWSVVHSEQCSSMAVNDEFFSKTTGVRHKKHYDENGTLTATWEYQLVMESPGEIYPCTAGEDPTGATGEMPGEQFVVTVINPEKDKNVHYFSVWPGYDGQVLDSAGGFHASEYGLPFTRRYELNGRFLSTETFDCTNASPSVCPATPQRRTYVTYEKDGTTNHRIDDDWRRIGHRTVYVGDGGKYVDVAQSDFDGYGNYRSTTTTGTFGSDPSRTTYIDYNSESQAHGRKADGKRAIKAADPWVLHKYTRTKLKSGTTVFAATHACFAADGLLKGVRTLSNPASDTAATHDLVTLYGHDVYGNLNRQDWFGGDTGSTSDLTDLCASSEGSTYRQTHGYAYGALSYTHAHDSAGTSILTLAQYAIDPSTGLVRTSTDTTGIVTTYVYGAVQRLTSVSTPGAAKLTYDYKKRGTPGYSQATVLVTVDSSNVANDSVQTIQYDGFGRVILEKREMPDDKTALKATAYDALGRVAKVSEWQSTTPSLFTEYAYDLYGRVTSVTTPDGKSSSVTYTGGGARELKRAKSVGVVYAGGSAVNEGNVEVREVYDAYGRLTEVHDAVSETKYTYDLADRLLGVQMTATVNGVATTQPRKFVYDARGFLDYEEHPENGKTDYDDYDAKGHATLQLAGASRGIFDLKLTYDAAERLVEVASREPAAGSETFRIAKAFEYDSANNNGLSQGRLIRTVRHNYSTALGDVVVTDSFTYGGSGSGANAGRLTKKTTLIENATTGTTYQKLEQTFTSNDLGLPATHGYPTCIYPNGACGSAATGTISQTYVKGHLRSIPGYVDEVTYHSNGLPHKVTHDGSAKVVDTQLIDAANGMARPKSIAFGNALLCTSPSPSAPDDITIASGASAALTAAVGGTGPMTVTWYKGLAPNRNTPVGTGTTYTTPALTTTTRYWFEARNSCGVAQSSTVAVTVCSAPSLSGPSSVTIIAGDSAILTVNAGSGTFTYQWLHGGVQVGTSASYTTPVLYADTSYTVRVTNDCGSTSERTVTVTVTCPTPSVSGPAPITIEPGGQATLIVTVAGNLTPFTYAWFIGTTAVGSNSRTYRTDPLSSTTTFRIRVTNSCGTTTEKTVTVTVADPPRYLVATSVSSGRIDLVWTAATSVAHYEVERKSGAAGYGFATTVTAASWIDQSVPAGGAYAYRVRAVHLDGTPSAYSNVDIGTTFTFAEPLQQDVTRIRAAHVIELRNAITALMTTANVTGTGWTDNLALTTTKWPIRAIHLTELRT
ncbi:MAG TPA: hypothetical protein VF846_12045, partial [Thermoanaerobaculia bacterium]